MICCRGAAAAGRRAAIDRYFLAAGPETANPHQRRAPAGRDRLTNGHRQTDGQTPDGRIDPAPHTMWAVPIIFRIIVRKAANSRIEDG